MPRRRRLQGTRRTRRDGTVFDDMGEQEAPPPPKRTTTPVWEDWFDREDDWRNPNLDRSVPTTGDFGGGGYTVYSGGRGAGGAANAIPFLSFPDLPPLPTPVVPPGPIKWHRSFEQEGAPEWWAGLTPDRFTPEAEYATMLNALIPFLSPEDQRTAGQELSRLFPDTFGGEGQGGFKEAPTNVADYSPETTDFPGIPNFMNTAISSQFTGSDRARSALEALDQIARSTGRTPEEEADYRRRLDNRLETYRQEVGGYEDMREELRANAAVEAGKIDDANDRERWLQGQYAQIEEYMNSRYQIAQGQYETDLQEMQQGEGGVFGPGYQFLRQVLDVMQDFGREEGQQRQSRRDRLQMMAALDPLMAQAQTQELGAYGPLAQALTTPFFSAGSVMPVRQNRAGQWVFGDPNKRLF